METKVLFFGLGFDKYKGYSENTEQKFLRFLEALQDKSKYLVTFRNDGSIEQYKSTYDEKHWNLVQEVPDGGFFVDPKVDGQSLLRQGRVNVIVNVALDMPKVRYGSDSERKSAQLISDFVVYVQQLCEYSGQIHITFMPHIYSDLRVISDILDSLPDYVRRNRVSVGPCISGTGAEDLIFSAYRSAELIVSMRFHPSVCGIGMGVPTFGISTYKKIKDLYTKLGLTEDLFEFEDPFYLAKLIDRSKNVLTDPKSSIDKRLNLSRELRNQIESVLRPFLLQ